MSEHCSQPVLIRKYLFAYNKYVQATRQRILDYLEQRGATSARQIAQAFGMTAANLRRHIAILQERGLLEVIGRTPAEGRGRPELLYAPVATSTLEPLTKALLGELEATAPRARLAALRRMASSLLGNPTPSSGQQSKRLLAAVQKLTPLGYKPSWEARPTGPQVVLARCPYAPIVANHPVLCQLDAHMLESMLGAEVEHTAKLQPGPHGLPQCAFVIKAAAKN